MYQRVKWVLSPLEKIFLYLSVGLLWLTGVLWLYLHYLSEPRGIFGSLSQTILLAIHGAAAMGFLIIFGVAVRHMLPGWQRKRQRLSGVSLNTFCLILVVTGWGLYYLGNEHWRNGSSIIHSVLGVAWPLIILVHVLGANKK